MKLRILVLSAAVGAGHTRAAQAVEAALRRLVPQAAVEHHDVLQFTNAVFRRVYAQAYLDLVHRAPHLLGYFYDKLDRPSNSGRNRGDRLRLAVEKLNLRKFRSFLAADRCNLVINTHFLPAALIATLTRGGQFSAPQTTVCTDFDTHRLWVNQPCRRYYCATEEGGLYLQHWGVPAADIEVTGIPIDPIFSEPYDRAALRKAHSLDDRSPVVLQLGGGFGVGPVEALHYELLSIEQPLQIVTVCGRNEALQERLSRLPRPTRHRVQLVGFTREIDQWMACADLTVSKPGGLTTSEALARGLPMVVANPIPGQESRNSDFLLEHGAAIKLNHPALARHKIGRLLDDPARLARMRQAAESLGRPRAAFDVVRSSLRLIGADCSE